MRSGGGILISSGTLEQQRSAERLMPVVQMGHQLLVTLLIVNSIANETLPIFMNRCATPPPPPASRRQRPRLGGGRQVGGAQGQRA